jgi:hypothetical protein
MPDEGAFAPFLRQGHANYLSRIAGGCPCDAGSVSLRGARLHREYSVCMAARGCTLMARRTVSTDGSDKPMCPTLPCFTRSAIAPTVSSIGVLGLCRQRRCLPTHSRCPDPRAKTKHSRYSLTSNAAGTAGCADSPRNPPLWCAQRRAYNPLRASSVPWLPSSTTRPFSITINRSMAAMVESR